MRNLVIAAVLLTASTARAESEPKSPTGATVASVTATAGGITLGVVMASKNAGSGLIVMSAATILGPSVGKWYAGDAGWQGLAIRGAGFGVMALTADDAFACSIGDGGEEGRNCKAAGYGFAIGAGVTLAGVLYDFATAGASARRANARIVQLAPVVVSGPRSSGTGLGLSARF
jgi:hypothetical protein